MCVPGPSSVSDKLAFWLVTPREPSRPPSIRSSTRREIVITVTSLVVRTLAKRVSSVSNARSPNASHAPSVASFLGGRRMPSALSSSVSVQRNTSAAPLVKTKKASPASPCRTTSMPRANLTSVQRSARVWSCSVLSGCKSGTAWRREIRSASSSLCWSVTSRSSVVPSARSSSSRVMKTA
jgi:hypothetical protein